MGIFGSTFSKQIDEFAKALAREVCEQLPPAPEDGLPRKASPRKIVATLERVCAKALGFAREHKLGVYKNARLANTFRWELIALGYDKQFVEEATQQLVLRVAGTR